MSNFFFRAQIQQFQKRFKKIPKILELDHLTVTGDVYFGRNVTLRGTVIVVANEGQRIDIPDGCILENRLLSGNLTMTVRTCACRVFMTGPNSLFSRICDWLSYRDPHSFHSLVLLSWILWVCDTPGTDHALHPFGNITHSYLHRKDPHLSFLSFTTTDNGRRFSFWFF